MEKNKTKKKPVERKIVKVSEKAGAAEKTSPGRATGLRIGAIALWLVAIAFEVLVILYLNGTLYIPGEQVVILIAGIALDLICVVIGSLLWKKANRIDPASEKNKVKFFLWNQMGVIAAVAAFLPLVIILLKNKELNKKTKRIVTVIAAVALVIAVAFSIDYDPVSQEDLTEAKSESTVLGDGTAYWTRWGKSYHFDPNCQTLLNSSTVYEGTVEEAFEANRTDPCDFCAGGAEE